MSHYLGKVVQWTGSKGEGFAGFVIEEECNGFMVFLTLLQANGTTKSLLFGIDNPNRPVVVELHHAY